MYQQNHRSGAMESLSAMNELDKPSSGNVYDHLQTQGESSSSGHVPISQQPIDSEKVLVVQAESQIAPNNSVSQTKTASSDRQVAGEKLDVFEQFVAQLNSSRDITPPLPRHVVESHRMEPQLSTNLICPSTHQEQVNKSNAARAAGVCISRGAQSQSNKSIGLSSCNDDSCSQNVHDGHHNLHVITPEPVPITVPHLCRLCRTFGSIRQSDSNLPWVTPCEVSTHNNEQSCWIVANGYAYDVTEYLQEHPGGHRCLLQRAGGRRECQEDFEFHSRKGKQLWMRYRAGKVVSCSTAHRRSAGECMIL